MGQSKYTLGNGSGGGEAIKLYLWGIGERRVGQLKCTLGALGKRRIEAKHEFP